MQEVEQTQIHTPTNSKHVHAGLAEVTQHSEGKFTSCAGEKRWCHMGPRPRPDSPPWGFSREGGPSIVPAVGPTEKRREPGPLQPQGPLLSPSSTLYLWPSCWILRRGLQGRESSEPWLCARCGAWNIMPPLALLPQSNEGPQSALTPSTGRGQFCPWHSPGAAS